MKVLVNCFFLKKIKKLNFKISIAYDPKASAVSLIERNNIKRSQRPKSICLAANDERADKAQSNPAYSSEWMRKPHVTRLFWVMFDSVLELQLLRGVQVRAQDDERHRPLPTTSIDCWQRRCEHRATCWARAYQRFVSIHLYFKVDLRFFVVWKYEIFYQFVDARLTTYLREKLLFVRPNVRIEKWQWF